MVENTHRRVQNVTPKAWRFAGEMDEIANTFAAAGYPAGFLLHVTHITIIHN